jgi:hypothetical protein
MSLLEEFRRSKPAEVLCRVLAASVRECLLSADDLAVLTSADGLVLGRFSCWFVPSLSTVVVWDADSDPEMSDTVKVRV